MYNESQTPQKEPSCTIIEMPAFLEAWNQEELISEALKSVKQSYTTYLLDMSMIRNVYSYSVRYIMRINEKVNKLQSQLYIVNACTSVRNALEILDIDSEIQVFAGLPVNYITHYTGLHQKIESQALTNENGPAEYCISR